MLAEHLSAIIKLDSRLLRSLGPWLFIPGRCASAFLSGRRVRYAHPFQLLAVGALVCSLSCWKVFRDTEPSLLVAAMSDLIECGRTRSNISLTLACASLAMPANILLFAMVLRVFHPLSRATMVDHLVHATYLFAFGFLVFGVALLVWRAFYGWVPAPLLLFLVGLASLIYFAVSFRRVCPQSRWLAAAKGLLLMPLFWFVVIPLTRWEAYKIIALLVSWWQPELPGVICGSPWTFFTTW